MKTTNIEMAVNAGIYIISMGLIQPWFKQIDLEKLDLNSQTNDILGQLFGSRKKGLIFLQTIPTRNPEIIEEFMYNGFAPSALYSADELRETWKNIISKIISGYK